MTHIRTCQECGHKQIANHPNTYADDSWRNLNCMVCKSEALDYGSEEAKEPRMIQRATNFLAIDGYEIGDAIKLLEKWMSVSGPAGIIDFRLDYEGDTRFRINYSSPETEAEQVIRLATETTLAETEKEKRRRLYEKLKLEFGD